MAREGECVLRKTCDNVLFPRKPVIQLFFLGSVDFGVMW